MTSIRRLLTTLNRRRLTAFVAALCVGATQIEVMLPDAHDGDAVASHVASAVGLERPAPTPTNPPLSHSGHDVHVDHCAHAHVFASSDASAVTAAFGVDGDAPASMTLRLASVARAPEIRPPIA